MQAVYVLFRDDHVMKLPYFIAIVGFVCALFAIGIPYLSALRIWLGVSTVLSLVYIVTAFVLALRDGKLTLQYPIDTKYSIICLSGLLGFSFASVLGLQNCACMCIESGSFSYLACLIYTRMGWHEITTSFDRRKVKRKTEMECYFQCRA